MSDPLDLDALESVARFAHPQDGWEAGDVWVFTSPVYADDNRLSDVLGMKFEDDDRADAERARGLANAAYIAASQPSTVLALIARVRAAEAALKRAESTVADLAWLREQDIQQTYQDGGTS